jgi:hypothetical protein
MCGDLECGHLPLDSNWQLARKEQDLAIGILCSHLDRQINPEMPAIETSDITRCGDSERAAASASSEELKNLAEKPFIRNIAATLDAMTGSMCEYERGDTWDLFPACTS